MIQGAIVGGGIAGLAAAIFGHECGMNLPVYEKDLEIHGGEHLLWIAPNGLHMLKKLGVIAKVCLAAVPQAAMQFATKDLKILMTLGGVKLEADCGFMILAIKRQVLWNILRDRLLELGGTIHLGSKVESFAQAGNKVLVRLEAKADPLVLDFLVGADGMGSMVRTTTFPKSSVVYQGIRTWLGQSETPVAASYVGKTIELWGQGTRFVLTSQNGRTVFWSALERPQHYEKNSAAIPANELTRLGQVFSSYHADIRAVLASADDKGMQRCNFGVVQGLSAFYKGRVALIGDAAHGMPPNMGQGASLGMEDAWCLIHSINTRGASPEAFRRFDAVRRPRARAMMRLANSMNQMFQPKSAIASVLRDLIYALVPDVLIQKRMARLYQVAAP